jgi:hypothetical protein
MLIRSAPQVCLVILPSGLTLELCYDHLEKLAANLKRDANPPARKRAASQSVWLFNHEVLLEAKVGQC